MKHSNSHLKFWLTMAHRPVGETFYWRRMGDRTHPARISGSTIDKAIRMGLVESTDGAHVRLTEAGREYATKLSHGLDLSPDEILSWHVVHQDGCTCRWCDR